MASGLKGKSSRSKLFNEFLIEKYGRGLKCVDVAGGNGDLTRELINPERGCAEFSVVVDPRQDSRCGNGINQIYQLFDIKIDEVRQECSNKDLLLGMHPDGAVNYIIEAACELKINFCIIPCCVFPSVYHRLLNNGDIVVERE